MKGGPFAVSLHWPALTRVVVLVVFVKSGPINVTSVV